MKRFTLLAMLVALFSVMTFAQKETKLRPMEPLVSGTATITGVSAPAQFVNKSARRADVMPPSTANVEEWYTAGGTFMLYGRYGFEDYTLNIPTVKVAVDGNDFYIQGLSFYFNQSWIKGTISGNTVTFENSQLVGGIDEASDYLVGGDSQGNMTESIVFNYDATAGELKSVTAIIAESAVASSLQSVYAYWIYPVFTKEKPKGPEVVVAPEGLKTDEWSINAMTNYGDPVSGYVNIGFDGTDVYLQGLCTYLPESWIKGSLDGNTITFPGNQYFGYYDDGAMNSYNFFLRQEGIIFTYDAEAGKMTAEGEIFIYTGGSNLKGDVYNNPVLNKVVEKAGTPATPNISQIYDGTDGPVVLFSIPTSDTEGNAMASSKLTFQFLKDVEQEISPVTFDPADYPVLTESMTAFPYGYTNGEEFCPKYIYLRQSDYKLWNKVGIQSIYTGGGVENKSEIFWLSIKDYEKATFNFNAMEVVCSSNDSNDGDITEDRTFTDGKVTLTVSPSTGKTPNRFWSTNNGPQLRVYGGTMTFEVPLGKVITKLVFNNGKWNDGNSADTGAFEGNVWMGYAQKVVVTIAGNTQLNSIEVFPTDYVPTAVVAPDGLVTDTYVLNALDEKSFEEPVELTMWLKAGFAGNDLYIQGLAADVNSNAADLWVKATKNEAGQYVIPANQFMGSVTFWMSSEDYYFTAIDDQGKLADTVLDYDAEKGQFTTDQRLAINASLTEMYARQLIKNVTITKFNEVAATPVDPAINSIDFGEWSHGVVCRIPTTGSNGETLNPQKLFYTVWVDKSGQQEPYVFKAEMYYGLEGDVTEVPFSFNYGSWDGNHSIYFYDDAAVFDTWTRVGIQSIYYGAGECKKSNIVWGTLPSTGISDVNADVNTGKAVIFNLAGQRLDAPQKGLNIINGRKVVIK